MFLFEENTDELLKPYFSNKKVPILIDEDLQVWDTLAIIEYISDKYPEKMAWPNGLKNACNSPLSFRRDALKLFCLKKRTSNEYKKALPKPPNF